MTKREKAVNAVDTALITFFLPFMGPSTWRSYPDSSYARTLRLVEGVVRRKIIDTAEEFWAGVWMSVRDLWLTIRAVLWPLDGATRMDLKHDDVVGVEKVITFLIAIGLLLAVATSVAFYESHPWWGTLSAVLYAVAGLFYALVINPDMLNDPEDDWL